MRALDDYKKERDRKLGNMLGACMMNMWICSCIMNTFWFWVVCVNKEYRSGLFGEYLIPLAVAGFLCLLYQKLIVKRERVIKKWMAYLLLNCYLILLLAHPSKLILLDGLVFGVMVMYPVWTDRKWVKWQTFLLVAMVIIRHVILYQMAMLPTDYWRLTNIVGMLSIGFMLYSNVEYVHRQTMLLGDATRMDAATGLYNHESFYEELEKRMKQFTQMSEQEKEEHAFCLFIADIDNFKKVNDTYGHAFGDEVLLGLAGLFKKYCGNKDFSARYGGEEFVMIVGGCHKKDALTRANTIRKEFGNMIFTDATGAAHQFTISMGVAEYDKPWDTASKFFDQADQALYQAKNTGKNRVCSA